MSVIDPVAVKGQLSINNNINSVSVLLCVLCLRQVFKCRAYGEKNKQNGYLLEVSA